MLRFLRIQRLAVIDSVEVEFDPGLNVLTGETGAGKSILVEAVGLLLGGRSSGDLVRTGEDSATVEAIFENDGTEFLVRREITAQGRSRAFVNGELTTAGALKELAGQLIELHGQHEHQTLLDPSQHLVVLDDFGALDPSIRAVADAFEAYASVAGELAEARRSVADRQARYDLATFQLGELDRAQLTPGEDVDLAATRQILANADRVERLCEEAYDALFERDDAVVSVLGGIWRRVGELAAIDPQFEPYLESKAAVTAQLDDLARFLRRYADGVEASPARLQEVEDRLALLERLKRKYGPTLAQVIAKRDALKSQLDLLEHGEERIAELETRCASARAVYLEAAEVLGRERRKVAQRLAPALERMLGELAMDRSRFEVRFGDPLPEESWGPRGIDRASFYLSPNPGEELRPLDRVVSGGELSRVMLALKTLTATRRRGSGAALDREPSPAAPGLIFDEVDAGIGGRVADVVGRKLRGLGSSFQVLCITHLPQIAAYADTHFQIEKRVERGRTKTTVARLDPEGRVEEIGRMLGGAGVTAGIRASAREMLAERAGRPPAGESESESKPKGESESRGRRSRS